jgi:hypothetical protein
MLNWIPNYSSNDSIVSVAVIVLLEIDKHRIKGLVEKLQQPDNCNIYMYCVLQCLINI